MHKICQKLFKSALLMGCTFAAHSMSYASESTHYCHEDTSSQPCYYSKTQCYCHKCCHSRSQTYAGYPAHYNAYYHPDSYYYDRPYLEPYYDTD